MTVNHERRYLPRTDLVGTIVQRGREVASDTRQLAQLVGRQLAVDQESDSPVYQSLAARIEKLRQKAITSVEESLAFLEQALQIAQDVVAADRAAEEGRLEELEPLLDPKRGALTQIVEENTPPGLHKIVPDIVFRIDSIVLEVAYTGWTESDAGDKKVRKELRAALKNFGLPVTGELFNKTYEYVRENY